MTMTLMKSDGDTMGETTTRSAEAKQVSLDIIDLQFLKKRKCP
jgi:hypothetical protein